MVCMRCLRRLLVRRAVVILLWFDCLVDALVRCCLTSEAQQIVNDLPRIEHMLDATREREGGV